MLSLFYFLRPEVHLNVQFTQTVKEILSMTCFHVPSQTLAETTRPIVYPISIKIKLRTFLKKSAK